MRLDIQRVMVRAGNMKGKKVIKSGRELCASLRGVRCSCWQGGCAGKRQKHPARTHCERGSSSYNAAVVWSCLICSGSCFKKKKIKINKCYILYESVR